MFREIGIEFAGSSSFELYKDRLHNRILNIKKHKSQTLSHIFNDLLCKTFTLNLFATINHQTLDINQV